MIAFLVTLLLVVLVLGIALGYTLRWWLEAPKN